MCNLSNNHSIPNVHYPSLSRLYTSHDVPQKALLKKDTDTDSNGKKAIPMNGLSTRLIHIYSYSSYSCSELLFMYNLFIRTDLKARLLLSGPMMGILQNLHHNVSIFTNGKIVKLQWSTNLDAINYIKIIDKLLRYKNAIVVIGFFNWGGDAFERALFKTNATKEFIFLGSDTVYFKSDGVFRVQPVREICGNSD